MLLGFPRPFYAADEPGTGGVTPPDITATITAAVARLAADRGGPEPALAFLVQQYGTKEREANDLRQRLPPDGAVVLTGDDVARWNALKDYTPDQITAALAERDALKTEDAKTKGALTEAQQRLAAHDRERVLTRAAKLVGYDADVLGELPGLPPVEIVHKDGKDVAEVVAPDGGRTELTAYVTQHQAKFLPALKLEGVQQRGTPYPAQHAGDPLKNDVAASSLKTFQAQRDARVNPLMPRNT